MVFYIYINTKFAAKLQHFFELCKINAKKIALYNAI